MADPRSDHDEIGRLLRRLPVPDPEGVPDMTDLLDSVNRRAEAEGLVDVAWTVTDSPVGHLTLAATPSGLVRLSFGDDGQAIDDLARQVSPRVLRSPGRLDGVRRQLDEYFEGQRHDFDVPLDWQLSRGFRRTVLGELVQVPYGQTVSYKELAERAGNPKASRAAGTAMATNPIAIVVPCHRCLRTGGDLGGYGGGLEAKAWLLHLEGARLLNG
ncbi:MAG TPA: methylated-DNA--[protein]-cysteine S-methyltransferase [Acidimicrobiales bacterium]|nr:methylated-DNA--[protein]-cysteine S-methyltransferase [Acidimicrobiales bacterium]